MLTRYLGLNFNGLSCETCKIFFRRNAAQPDVCSYIIDHLFHISN